MQTRSLSLVSALFVCFSIFGCQTPNDTDADPDETETLREGYVTVYTGKTDGGAIVSGAEARFESLVLSPRDPETDGSCTIIDVTFDGSSDPVETEVYDAGAITITGGTQVIGMRGLDEYGYYESAQIDGALYTGGEKLTVDVAGSRSVPSFHGTLIAPAPVTSFSPDPTATGIDRSKELAMSWGGGEIGEVVIYFATNRTEDDQTGRQVAVECRFDADAGGGTIPAEVLGALLPTDESTTGYVIAQVVSTTEVESDDWTTHLLAVASVEAASGNRFSWGAVTVR